MKSVFGMPSIRSISSEPLKWPSPEQGSRYRGNYRQSNVRTHRIIIASITYGILAIFMKNYG